jgi:hypothetical protein
VAQGEGPKFKPQYCKRKKKRHWEAHKPRQGKWTEFIDNSSRGHPYTWAMGNQNNAEIPFLVYQIEKNSKIYEYMLLTSFVRQIASG